MRLFCGLVGLGLFLAACGGSDGGALPGDPGAGPNVAEGGTSAAPEGGTMPVPEAGADAAKPDGGDASISMKDTRIDPIEVGHAWTYNVTVLGFYPACTNGVFVSNTLQASTLDGKTALEVQSLCQNAGTYEYSVDGDRVYAHLNGAWKVSLDAPVVEGHTWSDGFRDYRWESKGSVVTPAGTFGDCWSATTVASFTSYIVLCRGVGPVKWHYEDGFGNGYEAILTSKSF
jgi:hypothetical protein